MWQRVQTLYLLLATGLVVSLFFCTKAGDIPYTEYWPYLVLLLITGFLQVMALTTWKHRVFQMRTASLSAIILIALQGWLVYDFISTHNTPVFHVTAVFPIVAAILDFLAARSILADEMLVRSADRLRAAKRKKK
jgi:peptidoglycan/LPS O-acetylase OafA/YrhL